MTDPWHDWAAEAAVREAEEARHNERRRKAVAELLAARGHHHAAALIAISAFESVQVDNYDGGQYEGHLSVPAAQFDLVTDEIKDLIDAAAGAVIGLPGYQGLAVNVLLDDAPQGWDHALLEKLRDHMSPQHPSPLALTAADEA